MACTCDAHSARETRPSTLNRAGGVVALVGDGDVDPISVRHARPSASTPVTEAGIISSPAAAPRNGSALTAIAPVPARATGSSTSMPARTRSTSPARTRDATPDVTNPDPSVSHAKPLGENESSRSPGPSTARVRATRPEAMEVAVIGASP